MQWHMCLQKYYSKISQWWILLYHGFTGTLDNHRQVSAKGTKKIIGNKSSSWNEHMAHLSMNRSDNILPCLNSTNADWKRTLEFCKAHFIWGIRNWQAWPLSVPRGEMLCLSLWTPKHEELHGGGNSCNNGVCQQSTLRGGAGPTTLSIPFSMMLLLKLAAAD